MGKAIRWGIIGSGGWADHTFAPAIVAANGSKLCAVLGPTMKDSESFCSRHNINLAYSDLSKFVSDESIDAIWVAGPNHMHKAFSIAALESGKHVLCEKPMAISVNDCKEMIRAAKKSNRILHIAYNTRHHKKLQALQKKWISGAFGKPVHGRCHLYYPYPEDLGHRGRGRIRGWHSNDKQVGSWVYADVGTHLIDQLRWFLGDADKVLAAHNSSPSWGYRTPDHTAAMISFKNGAVGTITASTGLCGGKARLEFYADKGYIQIDGGVIGEDGKITTCIFPGREVSEILLQAKTYKMQVEAFANVIRNGSSYPLSPEDGMENIKLISQARGW